ncbi:MAG: flagellar basal body P-ring protein FlgI [Candidatus Eisenbacteria bacterium]|uniref:Flagellar P-ring protein n=1 Tax=Eiseniibacteriota bacterium TaxID=2212470 RepID=A0A956M2F2_UNCEI|nr:flagellar basal body P-ring protein FlgI [Candidatus Eisenbacteria bacterium]
MVSVLCLILPPSSASAARVRDLGHFRGMRENQLVGYGLVMGLDGTGDRKGTGFTLRSMSNLLESVGLTVSPDEMNVKNVAAVMVTAGLPPFARPGGKIDVTVASIGDATSLRGGILVQTPLEGADGQVYAVAQGPISVGGFSADSPGGSSVAQGQVTVGRVPSGGIIEREVRPQTEGPDLELLLVRPDVTTAQRVAEAITKQLGLVAEAVDPGTIRIQSTPDVSTMAQVGEVQVDPATPARVVINERTGTIVAGGEIHVHPVAISHGNLSIRIKNRTEVYQPEPWGPQSSQTAYADQSDIAVQDEDSHFLATGGTSTLEELAQALNALGVTPRDVIAIFQALKEAGALDAELVIM